MLETLNYTQLPNGGPVKVVKTAQTIQRCCNRVVQDTTCELKPLDPTSIQKNLINNQLSDFILCPVRCFVAIKRVWVQARYLLAISKSSQTSLVITDGKPLHIELHRRDGQVVLNIFDQGEDWGWGQLEEIHDWLSWKPPISLHLQAFLKAIIKITSLIYINKILFLQFGCLQEILLEKFLNKLILRNYP